VCSCVSERHVLIVQSWLIYKRVLL
jgi:hypothetical protein